MALLRERYPHYARLVAQHVKLDAAGPYRFAVTMELFRRSNRPTILMLAHDLGGGVRRHILDLVERTAGKANCLLLESTARGAALSVPALPGHPELALPADRASDLAHGAEVGRRDARAHPSSDEHGPRCPRAAASARRAVRRDGARLFRDLPAGEPAAMAAGRLLRRTGRGGLQCLHRRSLELRRARHRVVATRQCVAVHRGGAGDLSQRGRAPAPGALRLRPAGDRGAARAGGGRAVAAVAADARQGPRAARGGDRRARQPEGRGHRDDRRIGGRSGRAVHPRDRLRRTGAAGAAGASASR